MSEALRTATTCPYCGVGCGVQAHREQGRVTQVSGLATHPANGGRLCSKGTWLAETLDPDGRLLAPRIDGRDTDWHTALDHVAARWRAIIRESGPGAVAIYASGQLLTEDYYVANKLMKGFIGSANIDTNSRLCMASAVLAYQRAFGADAVPCCYADLEQADLLILVGWNAAWTHPVLYQRIAAAKAARPGMRVALVDPRRTATSQIADLHLALRPGTDAALFNGLLHAALTRGRLDRGYIAAHTRGWPHCRRGIARWDPATTSAYCDIDRAAFDTLVDWFCAAPRTLSCYSQGINQSTSGVEKCQAIINLHLATGRIGKPGCGPFSITGQPNAMGGREVGGLATQLAAHMPLEDARARERVARFWGCDRVADRPGRKAVDMFQAIAAGEIRSVWIMGTNPAVSLPDAARVRAALQRCELVIVSDCYARTDTARYAHVLLPAAGWPEKDGTVTNSERCISRQRRAQDPPGAARPDWWILSALARRLGHGAAFAYDTPHQVFVEHAALSGYERDGTRAFDIAGLATLDAQEYDALAPVQWPVPAGTRQGTPRLFGDGRYCTADGRARFVAVEPRPHGAVLDARHPFLLNTGRVRDQWHTMTRSGRSARLLAHQDRPWLEVAPQALRAIGVDEGDIVEVCSAHGACLLPVRANPGMRRDEAFAPMHWNAEYAGSAGVGALIAPRVDPHSGQPELKQTAVGIKPWRPGACAVLLVRTPVDPGDIPYWVRAPCPQGQRYELAVASAAQDWPAWLRARLRVAGAVIEQSGADACRRYAVIDGSGLAAMLVAAARQADLPSRAALESAWRCWPAAAGIDALIATPAAGAPDPVVCACFLVPRSGIEAAIGAGAVTVDALAATLRCGSRCGSCRPELAQLLGAAQAAATALHPPRAVAQAAISL